MKVQISAVIITFNEERNIKRCLDSIRDVVDEIVVVDSYSTDRTEEICQSYDVEFIKHRFRGHIQQKNWAILQASSPYILSLDADEVLSDKLRASILMAKENFSSDAYYFNRLTYYCGKWIRHTSWYPSRKLRLWDSRKGHWGGLNPHDRFILEDGSSKSFLKGDLLHYSYYSINEHLLQINSFSSIMAQSYYERGRRSSLFQLTVRPLWRFLKDFILLRGFLDGYYGYVVSINSAHEVFLKYAKLRNIYLDEKLDGRTTICFFNTQESWGGGERWHLDMISGLEGRKYRSIFISSPSSPLSTKLKLLKISGYSIRISNLSFLNPYKVFKLVRIFRREKVGVLVTNLSADMKIASIAGKIASIPRILYRRGSAIPVRDTLFNRYLFRRILNGVIANSQETKRTILANNNALIPEEKIRVIYNGVKLKRYHRHVKAIRKPQDNEIILGCAGRLSEEKGQIYLLEIMKLLKGSGLKYKLLIAGEGKLLNSLEKNARKLAVNEQVEFLGFVEDMSSFYSSIDIYLLPSQFEGFGYVLAEAMASRKPVVAFDTASSSEIVKHGETGYVTRLNDIKEMSDRVHELAGDKKLRDKMGQKGRKRVEALFSFEKNQQEFLQLIEDQSN